MSEHLPDDAGAATTRVVGRSRMSARERRRQLTNIGLELLADRPIQEVALDEVADRAGISRTLVFHYFPTKSDFYAAVVKAAGQRLLTGGRQPSGTTPRARVRSLISGYLRLVESSRDIYVRLVRGAAGGDPAVLRVLDELRWALVPLWLEAAEVSEGDGTARGVTRLLLRGWLASLEEVALVWDSQRVPRDVLIDRLTDSFFATVRHPDEAECALDAP